MTCDKLPELISSIADSFTAVAAIVGVIIAGVQLSKISKELKNNMLSSLLEIETQMNERKSKVDDLTHKIQLEGANWSTDVKSIYSSYLDTAIENWINAIDRFAFCILRNYLHETEWKTEYRTYIHDVILKNQKFFAAGSGYRNMIDLDNKWQRE